MCGITGIWNLNSKPVKREDIISFNDTQRHRGPDGGDVFIDEQSCLALGHRRLSIIDLTDMGKQPMSDVSGRYVITYNGEVFNYIELKQELSAKGHHFSTRTDTEVILEAYKAWGKECVYRFNGMWAFAIWDREQKTIFISRDRFGVKPLYYTYAPGSLFAFASETIAFSKLNGFVKQIDKKNTNLGVKYPFYLESVGETIYQQIYKLKPGHNAEISAGSKLTIHKWWKTEEHLVTVPDAYNDQVAQFKELLTDACRLRLRSDVNIGTALSGGLDSSSVYSLVREIHDKHLFEKGSTPKDWQTAFVAVFPDTAMDEKEHADQVVAYTNGVAKYIYPNSNNLADALVDEVKQEDFIYLSPPVVHNIYKHMRESGVTVSLDGHGVDEMLFGYPNMVAEWMVNEKDAGTKDMLCHTLAGMLNLPLEVVHAKYLGTTAKKENKGKLLYNTLPVGVKNKIRRYKYNKIKHTEWLQELHMPEDVYPPLTGKAPYDIPYRLFHVDILPTLLRNWDLASMRHGVEIRMPFMDWRLVTYIFSLPGSSKVGDGYTKKILRDAMVGLMPEPIRNRKHKIGINAPMTEWFNGVLSSFIADAVSSKSFLESDIWNGPLLRDHALKLTKEKAWMHEQCNSFWPYINAWLLSNK
ncbi:asparagine synthase (glutamine-hydrolyzing) [Chitinophagaceae bacterium IBVUCB1]|nr:asparagine synthase (glutamine-hydrolyzing) [Chitinophagaceae bacterium IBVUCB1]